MKKVLSMCGGGTSGYMTAAILERIESELQVKAIDCFDMIAGVSTGAIIGSLVFSGYNASEIKQFYVEFSEHVFGKPRYLNAIFGSLYDNQRVYSNLRGLIKDIDFSTCPIDFVCHALQLDKPGLKPKFWKSWEGEEVTLASIATASSCAPLLFRPFEIDGKHYFDGGVAMNDPSLSSFVDAKALYGTDDIKVLSIETGDHPGFDKPRKLKGIYNIGTKFSQLALDGGERSTQYIAKRLLGDNYLAVEPIAYLGMTSYEWEAMEAAVDLVWKSKKTQIISFLED